MKKKKIYVAPFVETIHVGIPSILAGTANNSVINEDGSGSISGGGGEADEGDEVLSRRGGGFWDDDF